MGRPDINPIDEIIDELNLARADWYKLYQKDFKVASIRLRKRLEFVIQASKQIKRDSLKYRKLIEDQGKYFIEENGE